MSWQYYNHAMIPDIEPHEEPDVTCLKDENIWKFRGGGIPLLARWTTEFDCERETEWWYVIKDTPFDIGELKAKRRYEINKGKKNFEVRRVKASEYAEDLFKIQMKALASWPEKYRPAVDEQEFRSRVLTWDKAVVYGGFDRKTNELCGYAYLTEYPGHLEFNVLRVNPICESRGINAAMVAFILEDNSDRISKAFYINDGAKSIRHETAFQDYLEKYFGFRKAYCELHICYRFPVGIVVKILYPFRDKINKESKIGSLISSVLEMERIRRACRKTEEIKKF